METQTTGTRKQAFLPENAAKGQDWPGRKPRPIEPLRLFKHHANVVQTGNEAASVNFTAARCPVAKPDDVCAGLAESGGKGKLLRI